MHKYTQQVRECFFWYWLTWVVLVKGPINELLLSLLKVVAVCLGKIDGCAVNGIMSVRRIGSTQHLKSTYGSGYVLELDVELSSADIFDEDAVATQQSRVNDAICGRMFTDARRTEQFGRHCVYQVPQTSVGRLSDVFAALEQSNLYYFLMNVVQDYVNKNNTTYVNRRRHQRSCLHVTLCFTSSVDSKFPQQLSKVPGISVNIFFLLHFFVHRFALKIFLEVFQDPALLSFSQNVFHCFTLVGGKYYDQRVCLFVCLSAEISHKPHV